MINLFIWFAFFSLLIDYIRQCKLRETGVLSISWLTIILFVAALAYGAAISVIDIAPPNP